ncbi:MAG TPA: cytochrome c family protein [Croceibacterium sp.]|nr:cytochrome c family protein [Croceibacterium sp.]
MTDRFNTIAGWTLFAGIVALGLSILSDMYFGADKPHRPETMGYAIEGVVEEGADEGPSLALLLASGDPAKGEASFAKCVSCHTINQGGANGIGPNLYGIMGQPIGKHAAGFAYSSDLASFGGEWTYEVMDEWLRSPKGMVPGTKMSFAGLGNPEERANVILYMVQNGGGPPLPEPPAEEPAAEGDEGAETGAAGPAEEAGQAAAGAVAQEQPEEDTPSATQPGDN